MKPIQVFSPRFRTEEILDEIRECLDSGWTGMGYKTVEFEKAWSDYSGLNYSHFISSNTVGLHLALNIMKIKEGWNDGDEIITTPLTFVSTNHSILYENLMPIFADVDESMCLDPKSVESLITEKTRAVMFVGIGGNTGKLEEISQLCRSYKLKLILDAAHMAGSFVKLTANSQKEHKITHVGQESDVVIFSFQAVKNLPTADSGMICFKDADKDAMVRKTSWLGIDKDTYSRTSDGGYKWKYSVPHLGFKYHGNSVMAAMGLVQLKYLDEDNKRRNEIAEFYDEQLESYDCIESVGLSSYCHKSSRHLYQILVKTPVSISSDESHLRNELIMEFSRAKIYPGVHYVDNTEYPMYKAIRGICPKARLYSKQLLTLPIHLNLDQDDLFRVTEVVDDFYRRRIG